MPSEGWLFTFGVVSLLLFVATGVGLAAKRSIPTGLAATLVLAGVGCLWLFPNIGKPGSLSLPGGLRVERAAERAENAAKTALATKEEVERLANQVAEAQQRIEGVHGEMRAAFKSIVETVYLSIGTRSMFPPPKAALDRMLNGLDDVARYAFPDPKQRDPWVREMVGIVQRTQPGQKKP